jgi:hypothetical protein
VTGRGQARAASQSKTTAAFVATGPSPARPRENEPSARPHANERSILVGDLRPDALSELVRRGFRPTGATKGALGPPIARLQLPRGLSVAAARRLIGRTDAGAVAAADTYYYIQEGEPAAPSGDVPACPAAGCDLRTLVGWLEPDDDDDDVCVSSPTIGLVDTRVDPSHPALAGQDVEVLDHDVR